MENALLLLNFDMCQKRATDLYGFELNRFAFDLHLQGSRFARLEMFLRACQKMQRYKKFLLDHKSKGKISVNNLQYRPQT